MFNVGDRVRVTDTTTGWREYVGTTGTVLRYEKKQTIVKPDRPVNAHALSNFYFANSMWTLERIDNPEELINEEW